MKLHFISAHKRIGPLRKSFGLSDGSSRSYPLAGKLTTHVEEVDVSAEGLREYKKLLVNHAANGHALMKGLFKKELNNESRRGMADKEQKTNLLVLDIDGVSLPDFKKGQASPYDVQRAAEGVIRMLPTALQDVSYIALGSSSFGMKDDVVSVHLHFFLEKPIEHRIMKDWLRSLNYTQESIYEKLELTPAKLAVKSIVDPCLAEASRIIYIAPPHFGEGASNPFTHDEQRVLLVEKHKPLLDMTPLIDNMSKCSAIIEQRKSEKLGNLQRALGISKRKRKYSKVCTSAGDVHVLQDPEPATLTMAYFNDDFVAYNVGAGDSNAYIVRRDNPEIVTCFKPDEPSFLFREADPQAYAIHIEKFGEQYEEKVDEVTGEVVQVRRMMFTDRLTDTCNTIEYDANKDTILELIEQNPATAADYMRYHGQVVPDPIPPYYLVNDPQNKETFYVNDGKNIINRFRPTKYMECEKESPFPEARFGLAWQISVDCPLISEIILHMLGDDMECFERFINWFAFIYQTRKKTKTAWLLQGTEGTGKGLFYHAVVRPIFGEAYSKQALLQVIADDQYNGWMEDCLFMMVDEFDMKATGSLKRTASMLKNAITEPTMMIRHMKRVSKDTKQHMNFIMGTNEFDSLAISDKRRFNITPRQKRMLNARKRTAPLLVFRKEYDNLIATELEDFCAFLRDFEVKESLVSSIYESEARTEALKMGQNSAERFFHNLQKGDFASFVWLLDKQDGSVSDRELPQLRRVKDFIRANLDHVNHPRACYLHKDDLRTLYSFLAGHQISENAFGRMLGNHEFVTKRETKPVGALKPLVTRPRCIEVRWVYEDLEALKLLKASNVPLASVTPIKQPQISDEEMQQRMAEAEKLLTTSNGDTW